MAINPFEFVNDINGSKKNIIKNGDASESDYVPFVINKAFSYHLDTILYAQDMNMAHELPKMMQYEYYLNSIKKGKRFAKWHKKEGINNGVDVIRQYYGFSYSKAIQAAKVLTEDQVEELKEKMAVGGVSKEPAVGVNLNDGIIIGNIFE